MVHGKTYVPVVRLGRDKLMFVSVLVLVVSCSLFLFYGQAICERVLRREFSHPYFKEVIQAIRLEYPRLQDSFESGTLYNYSDARLALKCDFIALEYLLKNGGPSQGRLSRAERIMVLYFRFLLFCLPVRHVLKLQERETVLKLTTILQFFANSLGEKLSVRSFATSHPGLKP
jgi:hypothetical protein